MPFDSIAVSPAQPLIAPLSPAALIDAASEPCADWTALNPDRALALLFVAPRDCAAVDVLARL
ncbi:hypothetical protein GCM10009116_12480 [Brevundimonas basaltis]|uniref:Uncharacterized protein n=1 Tax=Brevundimonas basaltis TaxID=472166 RepID=A0A7W8MFK2_9CAUL|nr:hypothetical protein [Brevundimonas basaltis]MBB5290684.1 hypothetical protein [Brevundimonas basaltis]